mgnify:CR=1 FL=1
MEGCRAKLTIQTIKTYQRKDLISIFRQQLNQKAKAIVAGILIIKTMTTSITNRTTALNRKAQDNIN